MRLSRPTLYGKSAGIFFSFNKMMTIKNFCSEGPSLPLIVTEKLKINIKLFPYTKNKLIELTIIVTVFVVL